MEGGAGVLSQPIQINRLTLKNRIVMGPMKAIDPDKSGGPSAQTHAFLEARARGGVGMIIVGGIIATRDGYEEAPAKPLLRFDRDDLIPALKAVADTVHVHGVPIIAELMPRFGRMGKPGRGRPIIAASPVNVVVREENFPPNLFVPGGFKTPIPDEATLAEIREAEQGVIDAAGRAHEAGWDGVEVAAHMSYFVTSFLSPRTNRRTDEYGGSEENRARILVNIVTGIRERLGKEFVVGLRITANEYLPDGQGAEGYAAIAKRVEAAGIDYVALAPGCYERMDKSASSEDGELADGGEALIFKRALSVPILLPGIHDPERGGRALAEGKGDLLMVARPMLADPDYARKVTEGRLQELVRCNRDNLCMRRLAFGLPIRCDVNPAMGRESRKGLPPAKRFVQAPLEKMLLGLTGSKWLMGMISKAMKSRAARRK